MDDLLGDLVDTNLPLPVRSANFVTEDDDDDFGMFQDVEAPVNDDWPDLLGDDFASSSTKKKQVQVAEPHAILNYITDHIMTIPAQFLEDLSRTTPIIRKRVINHRGTKLWLQGIVAASVVAGRVMRGRKHRTKGSQETETLKAAQRLCHQWETIMPRLTSLSGGTLRLKGLLLDVTTDVYDERSCCHVCALGEDQHGRVSTQDGIYGHRTCVAVNKRL